MTDIQHPSPRGQPSYPLFKSKRGVRPGRYLATLVVISRVSGCGTTQAPVDCTAAGVTWEHTEPAPNAPAATSAADQTAADAQAAADKAALRRWQRTRRSKLGGGRWDLSAIRRIQGHRGCGSFCHVLLEDHRDRSPRQHHLQRHCERRNTNGDTPGGPRLHDPRLRYRGQALKTSPGQGRSLFYYDEGIRS